MKYPEHHKSDVHAALNHSAAQQIRAEGIDAISVAKVMAAQGLTKGGFYAHYSSREALIIEAMQTAFEDVNHAFYKLIQKRSDAQWISKVIERYLSDYHRDKRATSCPVASLTNDVSRQNKKIKKAFETELKSLLSSYENRLKGLKVKEAEDKAIALFSLLVGGLQLSRAVNNRTYSDQILDACIANAQLLLKATP